MLLDIREKVHGVFASVVLVLVCILFGLWGIQNYLGGGKENPIVSVGDKDFFQSDVNRAYQQYLQSLSGMKFDEETIRKQALGKLVRDEVLWQYVRDEKLAVSDETVKDVLKNLEYFRKDGKFDKDQYRALLNSQGMSSEELISRMKKAIMMEQFQRAITDSSFVTAAEVNGFFKIQNQKRDLEYLTMPLPEVTEEPSDDEISAYYQQHLDAYQTEEQVSIDYVELSLDKLAADVIPTEEQLQSYYEEQKAQFTTKERRRISHILFAFTKDPAADEQALQKAIQAKQELSHKDFAKLAAEISDDKASAKKGGDLGLFSVGVMEKAFEDVASKLKLNEVSDPVKSAFGYHLIKVTELVPGEVKTYAAIKPELIKSYQKAQAENAFNNLAEKVTEVSYENPDNLNAAAKLLGVEIKKTALFGRNHGEGIAADEKVRQASFSEDVLKGNNSEPLEIGNDKLVVLRMQSHLPSVNKELKEVKAEIIKALQHEKAQQKAVATADQIKNELMAGKSMSKLAESYHLTMKKLNDVGRNAPGLPPELNQAVFRAAKPQNGQPSVIVLSDPAGGKIIVSIIKVTEGEMTEADKAKQAVLEKSIADAFGKAQFDAVLNALQARADIKMYAAQKQ
ncbi:MAG: SurA N-terminal domain-containing protein [Methylomonas sp.]|jgi:peptidyl-prolyl cis-trans isomerase D